MKQKQQERKQFFRWFYGRRVLACAQQVNNDEFRVGLAFRHESDKVPNPDLAKKIAQGRFAKKGFLVDRVAVVSGGLELAVRERVGEICDIEYSKPEFCAEGLHQVAHKLRMPVWFMKECWR